MPIYLNPVLSAINKIVNGETDYLLISKDEYDSLTKKAATPVPAPAPMPPTPPPPPQPTPPKEPGKYKEIKFGTVDPFEQYNDAEPHNTPIYYVPVGDGLYRATQDRRIFLFHCCYALYKAGLTKEETNYGEQVKYLTENEYHMFDICLAIKAKIKDISQMIGKENTDIPIYIRNKWKMGFAPTCPWHPIQIKENKDIHEANLKSLREVFGKEEKEPDTETMKPEEPKEMPENVFPLIGSKYKLQVMRYTGEEIDWDDPANHNVLICYFRDKGARGLGKAVLNMDAITRWIKEDESIRTNMPFKTGKDIADFFHQHKIPVKTFFEGIGVKWYTNIALSKDLCNKLNDQFSFEFVLNTAKKNYTRGNKETPKKEPKKEKPTPPKEKEPEYIRTIRRLLWSQRKWGITTLRKLLTILEPEVDRQEVIDTFKISEYELNHPTELTSNTAYTVNKFCGKAVCYGRG